MNILHVIGARPNFMKVAPVYRARADRLSNRQTLVHTGQHYDFNMSDVFLRQLDLPAPDMGANNHDIRRSDRFSDRSILR
jgi:UDP-N-acetylglucosamine 2-epimerase (non-hydrolysing)